VLKSSLRRALPPSTAGQTEGTLSHPPSSAYRKPSLFLLPTQICDEQASDTPAELPLCHQHPKKVQISSPTLSSPRTHRIQRVGPIPSANRGETIDCGSQRSGAWTMPSQSFCEQDQLISVPSICSTPSMLIDNPRPRPSQPSPPPTPQTGIKKPLKPLASFLGEFLQTVRNATHMRESIISRPHNQLTTTKGRTRKVRNLANNDIMTATTITPVHKPINSIKSFIHTSVRNMQFSSPLQSRPPTFSKLVAQPQPLLNSAPEPPQWPRISPSYTIQNDPHKHSSRNYDSALPITGHTTGNSTLLNGSCHLTFPPTGTEIALFDPPPSPDILTALQPQQYQIVLSSSPSDSRAQQKPCSFLLENFGLDGATNLDMPTTLKSSINLFGPLNPLRVWHSGHPFLCSILSLTCYIHIGLKFNVSKVIDGDAD